MASTYSDRLKLELMATGANANTWGTNTNNNLNVVDAFAGGYIAKSVAGSANITLSTGNADPSAEAANKVIELTGALTGSISVFVPAVENEYIFFNNTTGSHTLKISATGHDANGLAITQGAYSHVYCEGSANFKIYNAVDKLGATSFKGAVTMDAGGTVTAGQDLTAGSGDIIIRSNGAVTATTFVGDGQNLTGIGGDIPSGSKMVFYQASAPTGWTQDTTAALSESVMSVVTGTGGGTGGSTAFFSSFLNATNKSAPGQPVSGSVSGTVGQHTLSTPEIASHRHQFRKQNPPQSRSDPTPQFKAAFIAPTTFFSYPGNLKISPDDFIDTAGGGGQHSHPFSGTLTSATTDVTIPAADVKFANVIIAAKD